MTDSADSAGKKWVGRGFEHHPGEYAGDDGTAPPVWSEAVSALRAGTGSIEGCVAALRGTRLLVPLLAAGETTVDDFGRQIEKTQELSIVTVAAPDGGAILPMFASASAMGEWNPSARPVPVSIERAAAAALDGPGRIVIDPGSALTFVVTRPALEALVTGDEWRSPLTDETVQGAVLAALFEVPAVHSVVIAPGDPLSTLGGAEVEAHALVSDERSAADQVRAAAARLGQMAPVRSRVSSLAVRLHRTTGEPAALPLSAPAVLALSRAQWRVSDAPL